MQVSNPTAQNSTSTRVLPQASPSPQPQSFVSKWFSPARLYNAGNLLLITSITSFFIAGMSSCQYPNENGNECNDLHHSNSTKVNLFIAGGVQFVGSIGLLLLAKHNARSQINAEQQQLLLSPSVSSSNYGTSSV